MPDRDSPTSANFDAHLGVLAIRYLDGSASPQEVETLTAQLESEPASRQWFAAFCVLTTGLDEVFAAQHIPDHAAPTPIIPPAESFGVLSPLTFADNTSLGTYSRFTSGWPLAYLIATVIFAIGLTTAALVHMSQPAQLVAPSTPRPSPFPPLPLVVARVTGMVDCVWSGNGTKDSPLVALGDRLALKSGLLEITYDTGAKVILQGPVTYEVESPTGGYLSVGKLTARLEKRSEARGQRSESANQKSEIINRKSPDLWPLTSDLFAIRTPTALVTDLGTEFGVEVDKSGVTKSHVFRGSVQVQAVSHDGKPCGNARVLHENQSASVNRNGVNRTLAALPSPNPGNFVRQLPKQMIKTLDLVDVVAGGDGFSGRRGRGIDPTTGRIMYVQPENADLQGDYQYHRVDGIPFVDGVFIPDGSKGAVRIDSAGHVFPDCPTTDNCSWAWIWAGGKLPPALTPWMSATLDGVDYCSPEHSLLVMHANKGITFDLDAIRRSNPGCSMLRFHAVTGNAETTQTQKGVGVFADIWVLVDGQVRLKRREVSSYNGAMPVTVPIHAKDRFLTLAATDGGNSHMCDHIIFGDPQLDLATPETPGSETK
jgi:hypothetical protein